MSKLAKGHNSARIFTEFTQKVLGNLYLYYMYN